MLVLALVAGCGSRPILLEELDPTTSCRQALLVGDSVREGLEVRWILPERTDQLHQLNAWCAAVGPAVVGGWAPRSILPSPVDSLAVVVWNVHVGGGDLRRLIDDLRSGRLTNGEPVVDFVLLLQEAFRGGAEVPPFDADLPGGSGIVGAPPGGVREGVVADAEALGLDLFYAPSMRNGEGEDRGNAVLSTQPLREPFAIPLPVARQRRVAVGAWIEGVTSGGVAWRLQATSLHLESDAAGFASDRAARLEQTRAFLEAVPDGEAVLVGGDFNTRRLGQDADLVRVMLEAYPDTPPFPQGPTYRRAWGLYRLYLDYLFARLPDGGAASYRRLPSIYGSDHYPLLGWVRPAER